jgi:uncharacterized protein (DUF2384 family)
MGCGLPVMRLRRDKLLHVAKRVFGSEEKARAWVRAPNDALDGLPPEDLVETLDGLQRAVAELESLAS